LLRRLSFLYCPNNEAKHDARYNDEDKQAKQPLIILTKPFHNFQHCPGSFAYMPTLGQLVCRFFFVKAAIPSVILQIARHMRVVSPWLISLCGPSPLFERG